MEIWTSGATLRCPKMDWTALSPEHKINLIILCVLGSTCIHKEGTEVSHSYIWTQLDKFVMSHSYGPTAVEEDIANPWGSCCKIEWFQRTPWPLTSVSFSHSPPQKPIQGTQSSAMRQKRPQLPYEPAWPLPNIRKRLPSPVSAGTTINTYWKALENNERIVADICLAKRKSFLKAEKEQIQWEMWVLTTTGLPEGLSKIWSHLKPSGDGCNRCPELQSRL